MRREQADIIGLRLNDSGGGQVSREVIRNRTVTTRSGGGSSGIPTPRERREAKKARQAKFKSKAENI